MHKNTIETNCTVAQIIITYIFHCYCYYLFDLCPLLLSSLLIYNPNSKKVAVENATISRMQLFVETHMSNV